MDVTVHEIKYNSKLQLTKIGGHKNYWQQFQNHEKKIYNQNKKKAKKE